jgi:hypothetical protein
MAERVLSLSNFGDESRSAEWGQQKERGKSQSFIAFRDGLVWPYTRAGEGTAFAGHQFGVDECKDQDRPESGNRRVRNGGR